MGQVWPKTTNICRKSVEWIDLVAKDASRGLIVNDAYRVRRVQCTKRKQIAHRKVRVGAVQILIGRGQILADTGSKVLLGVALAEDALAYLALSGSRNHGAVRS